MLRTRFTPSSLMAGAALGALLITIGAAQAATPASPMRPPIPPNGTTNAQGASAPAQRAALPMPDSVARQAAEQADGFFGTLVRPRTPGQIQEVWDRAKPEEAVYTAEMCEACTYKIRTREFMVTVIELPRGEEIASVDLGDTGGFSVKPRGKRRLAVRPVGHGYDSSLVVYGKSGALYPFYLRAEGFNAMTIPDLVVRIAGAVTTDKDLAVPGFAETASGETPPLPEGLAGGKAGDPGQTGARGIVAGLTQTAPGTADGDFVASAPFDPSKLRGWGDYTLWGDKGLRPETVFRDDHFTYIRFGERWKDIELPTAYVVVDGIDELVNTRVQGSTYIIESTRPLITLKSGESFLCIEYEGEA